MNIKKLNEEIESILEQQDMLPFMKTCFKGVKGIIPNDIYKDDELQQINIPFNPRVSATSVREQIVKRVQKCWLKNYIDKITLHPGCIVITFKVNI